jgi:thioredoxin-related protein
MNNLYKKVELLSNIAIIIVALMLGVVLVKHYIIGSTGPDDVKTISAGTKISLPDVKWDDSRQTLLIVLSQGCHFCSESVPFYQRLTEEVKGRSDVRLLAVLPQPPGEGQKYLDDLGVPIKDVKQAELSSIPVRGTPTLVLVDSKGVVTDAWIGKLPSDKEAEVISKLQCDNCGL